MANWTGVLVGALVLAGPVWGAAGVGGVWRFENLAWQPDPTGGTNLALGAVVTADEAEVLPGLTLWLVSTPGTVASVSLAAGTTVGSISALSMKSYGHCGGGSPRVQLAVDTGGDGAADGNVFVYAGPASFGGCPANAWFATDLLDGVARFDASQVGGSYGATQAAAHSTIGPHAVLRATVVWDSWWMVSPNPQMYFDDLVVNGCVLGEPSDHATSVGAC